MLYRILIFFGFAVLVFFIRKYITKLPDLQYLKKDNFDYFVEYMYATIFLVISLAIFYGVICFIFNSGQPINLRF